MPDKSVPDLIRDTKTRDDIVWLRKARSSGDYKWEVVRVGADISSKCLKCQRRVLLARSILERRMKTVVARSN